MTGRRAPTRGLAAAVVALTIASAAAAQAGTWRPEDRLVIGDYSRVSALAAGRDRAYVVTPDAVVILDPRTRGVLGVIEAPGVGALRNVRLALVDPIDASLWMVERGRWLHLQPDLQLWEEGGLPATVQGAAFDAADPIAGLFLRTGRGWLSIPRGASQATPAPPPAQPQAPPTLDDALRENPSLEGFAAGILLEGRRTPARYTSAARTEDGLGWFIGTDGLGVLWQPTGTGMPERLALGLPGARVGAVFAVPGGVWVATEPELDQPAGLAWVSDDAGETRQLGGRFGFGLEFSRAWDIDGTGRMLWVGTDVGVLAVPTDDSPPERLDEGAGLPDRFAYGLGAWRDTVFVATRGGLARISPSGDVEPIVRGFPGPAFAVTVQHDTLWVGTPSGPFAVADSGRELARIDAPDLRVELREPVVGFAHAADTLVALTRRRLLHRDPLTGAWAPGPDLSVDLGELRAIHADDHGFWVAGERGVAHVWIGGSAGIPLRVPGDIPGEVLDIGHEDGWLWVGTTRGLVRFRLDAVRR